MTAIFYLWFGGTVCQAMSIVTYALMVEGCRHHRSRLLLMGLVTSPAWPVIQLWCAVKSIVSAYSGEQDTL